MAVLCPNVLLLTPPTAQYGNMLPNVGTKNIITQAFTNHGVDYITTSHSFMICL